MSISIIPKEDQARGQFNDGAILENKPIGFPREGGKLTSYSNLFYWADAWSENGSTIGEHPHKGFEIMSFVIKGQIEHYDNQHREWRQLSEGSAQIIRSGTGITHAEHFHPGSEIFQIWLDPNLEQTIKQPATYTDYPADSFPVEEKNGQRIKTFKGEGSPMTMDTENVTISEMTLMKGKHELSVPDDTILSCYVMDGAPTVDGQELERGMFFTVQDMESFKLQMNDEARLFIIESPVKPSYKTYGELMQASTA